MKKVLLITYFFPPANSVAGMRAWSWAKYFHEYGIYPSIITRHWKGNESTWSDLTDDSKQEVTKEVFNEYEIYRLPSRKMKSIDLLKNNMLKLSFFSKIYYFFVNMLGHFNVEADARSSFATFIYSHLKENKYDLIIVTSPPLNLVRLASDIHQRTGIPVHVDFRDLWNNGYLNAEYNPALNQRIIDCFKKRYIRMWLKDASGISAVSDPIARMVVGTEVSDNVFVMTNGFDETIYNGIVKENTGVFRFSLIGSYYIQQDLSILISGLKTFLKDKTPKEFRINLIGLSVHSSVADHIMKEIPNEFIYACDRVGSEEAARFIVNSEVLFQSGWQGYRGIYTTKLFDFIASGNKVLIAPGDDDVIDELVEKTNAGTIVNSTEEFTSTLNEWFYKWKDKGRLHSNLNELAVEKYSRHYNARIFAEKIKLKY